MKQQENQREKTRTKIHSISVEVKGSEIGTEDSSITAIGNSLVPQVARVWLDGIAKELR